MSMASASRRCRPTCWRRPTARSRTSRTSIQTLKDWADANKDTVEKVGIIIGFGYDEATLAEHRPPTAADLDQVSTDIPVYVVHQSGHIGVANSKMLEIAGITAAVQEPPGGVIERKPGTDEPDGVLQEAAHFQVLFGMLSKLDPEGAEAVFKAGVELEMSFGYTTADEGRATASQVAVMQAYADANKLPIDIVAYPDVMNDAARRDQALADLRQPLPDRRRQAHHRRIAAGQDRLARPPLLRRPPGQRPDYVGYAAVTNDQAIDAIDDAFKNGYSDPHPRQRRGGDRSVHRRYPRGDAEIRQVDRRPVLVHGQFMREDQVDALKELRIHPSFFPMHTFYWGDWHREQTVGPSAGRQHLAHRLGGEARHDLQHA